MLFITAIWRILGLLVFTANVGLGARNRIEAYVGEEIALNCSIKGKADESVSWMKGNRNLTSLYLQSEQDELRYSQYQNELVIHYLLTVDSGIYHCGYPSKDGHGKQRQGRVEVLVLTCQVRNPCVHGKCIDHLYRPDQHISCECDDASWFRGWYGERCEIPKLRAADDYWLAGFATFCSIVMVAFLIYIRVKEVLNRKNSSWRDQQSGTSDEEDKEDEAKDQDKKAV